MACALPHLPYAVRRFSLPEDSLDYQIETVPRISPRQSGLLHSPQQNHLLASLPDADYARLFPHLELMHLPRGAALHEVGGRLNFGYFLTAGTVGLLCVMENGTAPAVAITGYEGMVGTSLYMGARATPNRAVVQVAGYGYRLRAAILKQEFERGSSFCQLLLGYTQSLITQMGQTVVCNRYHGIEQQLCRWLLLHLDRSPTNELSLTQELLANILGVRREGITEAAGKLQEAEVIRYKRGHITVLDRKALQHRVCECYEAVKGEVGCDSPKIHPLHSHSNMADMEAAAY